MQLGKQLNCETLEDFYRITKEYVYKMGGRYLLDHIYNGSLPEALKFAFPDHNWLPWKFDQVQLRYWSQKDNQRAFLDWLGHELGLKHMADWYNVTQKEIGDMGGLSLLNNIYQSSPARLIQSVYSEYPWKLNKFDTKLVE